MCFVLMAYAFKLVLMNILFYVYYKTAINISLYKDTFNNKIKNIYRMSLDHLLKTSDFFIIL